MEAMNEKMNIRDSIASVMQDIGVVGKKSVSKQGYSYRSVDALMNALRPALLRAKMFIVPTVLNKEREERVTDKGATLLYTTVTVKYDFYAEDGSSISAVVVAEGMDSGDKSCTKAMTSAFKTACFQTFCIPTEETSVSECQKRCPEEVRSYYSESRHIEPEYIDPNDKINKTMVGALMNRIANEKGLVKEISDLILSSYKISMFNELTLIQYEQLNRNWKVLVSKAEEKKNESTDK